MRHVVTDRVTWSLCHSSEPCKTTKLIKMPFGLLTPVGRRMHKFNCIRQVALMCPHGMKHCRHLPNTIKPFHLIVVHNYVGPGNHDLDEDDCPWEWQF